MDDELLTFDPKGDAADAAIRDVMLQHLGLAMPIIARLDLDALISTHEMADSYGPFLDPTAYQGYLSRGDGRVLEKFLRALQEPVRIWREEIEPRMERGVST